LQVFQISIIERASNNFSIPDAYLILVLPKGNHNLISMVKPVPVLFVLYLVIALHGFKVCAQTNQYTQFWNEFAFTKPLKNKLSVEGNLGQTYTAVPPEHKSMFASSAQIYMRGWLHYYPKARWRFSMFFAYYYNKYVPEIDQREYSESRLALQATWFPILKRLTLSTKLRLEDRHIQNTEGYMEGLYRLCNQWKMLYPINGKRIRGGIVYALVQDDIYVKTASNVAGSQFFDRNAFTAGAGYCVTDNMQVEVTYGNEFLPRPTANEMYHALQINFSFNNFVPGVIKIFKKKEKEPGGEEDKE
jgi:hypothetical protein